MKKTLFIILAVIVSIILLAFSWAVLTREDGESVGESISNTLPFGSGEGLNIPGRPFDEDPLDDPTPSGQVARGLFQISSVPVAGAVSYLRGTTTMIRYAERATGHIYDVNPLTLEKIKITNNTLPKIYEAYFKPDGSEVLLRSLANDTDTVENLNLTLTPPAASSTTGLHSVSITPLRGDMRSVAVVGDSLVYALKDTSSVVASNFRGGNTRTLLTTPFKDWRIVSRANTAFVFPKASANARGYAYALNTTNGGLSKVLGPLDGLVAVPDSLGRRVAYSYTQGAGTKTFALNLDSQVSTEILPATLAEKCVWGSINRGILYCGAPTNGVRTGEPDNWYKGVSHFADNIWKFDTAANISEILVEPTKSFDLTIDVENPTLAPSEDYLIFTNKEDLSLWALKLE